MRTKTEKAILDRLTEWAVNGIIPCNKNDPRATHVYHDLSGHAYYITGAQAQALVIVSDAIQEDGKGGTIERLDGNKMEGWMSNCKVNRFGMVNHWRV